MPWPHAHECSCMEHLVLSLCCSSLSVDRYVSILHLLIVRVKVGYTVEFAKIAFLGVNRFHPSKV